MGIKKLRIVQDLKKLSRGNVLRAVYVVLLDIDFHAVMNYRIAHALNKIKLVPVCKVLMAWNRIVHSVDIDYRADLAGGFSLMHGIGVVIGKDVRTLGPVRVYQHVTLGGNNYKVRQHEVYGEMTQPILEENSVVYAGACCFGPAVIGREGDRSRCCLYERCARKPYIFHQSRNYFEREYACIR